VTQHMLKASMPCWGLEVGDCRYLFRLPSPGEVGLRGSVLCRWVLTSKKRTIARNRRRKRGKRVIRCKVQEARILV
jgi:hypothetical protein